MHTLFVRQVYRVYKNITVAYCNCDEQPGPKRFGCAANAAVIGFIVYLFAGSSCSSVSYTRNLHMCFRNVYSYTELSKFTNCCMQCCVNPHPVETEDSSKFANTKLTHTGLWIFLMNGTLLFHVVTSTPLNIHVYIYIYVYISPIAAAPVEKGTT